MTIALAVAAVALLTLVPGTAAKYEGLLAPPSACPNQSDPDDAIAVQEAAMLCMTNFARDRRGLLPLARVGVLGRSARYKSADMIRCDQFDHEACGRDFTYWMEQVGYFEGSCVSAGENIAWGTGSLGAVRSIFKAWMGSSGHRANILNPDLREIGIGLKVGALEGISAAHVWTQQFGSRDC
jgi:uncharacterized protein YkwD